MTAKLELYHYALMEWLDGGQTLRALEEELLALVDSFVAGRDVLMDQRYNILDDKRAHAAMRRDAAFQRMLEAEKVK